MSQAYTQDILAEANCLSLKLWEENMIQIGKSASKFTC